MGFMYSWSYIKRVLFSVAKLMAYTSTIHIYTYNKVNFSLRSAWLLCILETLQNAAAVLSHTVHVHSYRYSHRISILLGLGTPLLVPLLCAISLLSSQGAKTRTHDMANSAAIPTFHKNGDLHNDVIMQVAIASELGTSIHGVVFLGSFYSGNGW